MQILLQLKSLKQKINGAAYRKMLLSAAAAIEIQKQQINDLNVFPVPDGPESNTPRGIFAPKRV